MTPQKTNEDIKLLEKVLSEIYDEVDSWYQYPNGNENLHTDTTIDQNITIQQVRKLKARIREVAIAKLKED